MMVSNIPWTAPAPPAPAGLLLSPDWWVWLAYLLVLPMAWCLMPGQLRESVKALWAPVGQFFAGLHVTLACGWYLAVVLLSGAFLVPLWGFRWDNWPQDGDEGYRQPRRLAYMGFDTPIKT